MTLKELYETIKEEKTNIDILFLEGKIRAYFELICLIEGSSELDEK